MYMCTCTYSSRFLFQIVPVTGFSQKHFSFSFFAWRVGVYDRHPLVDRRFHCIELTRFYDNDKVVPLVSGSFARAKP